MDNNDNTTVSNVNSVLGSAYKFFQDLDKDKSGHIDKNELIKFMRDCGIPLRLSEDEFVKLLKEQDLNGNGVWDFAEFMYFLGKFYSSAIKYFHTESICP